MKESFSEKASEKLTNIIEKLKTPSGVFSFFK